MRDARQGRKRKTLLSDDSGLPCTCTERGDDPEAVCDGESCAEPGASCSTLNKPDADARVAHDRRWKRPQ